MQWVEIVRDARHAGDRFYRGERRFVPADIAGLLKGNGWAKDIGGEVEAEPQMQATLKVHNAVIGVTAEDA